METVNPFKKVRLKERLGFETRGMRWLYRALYPFFHCRAKVPESLGEDGEPIVFVANHYDIFGPLSFMVSVPLNSNIWINEEMVDPEAAKITLRPGMKKLLPFLNESRIDRVCSGIASFIVWVLTSLGMIPVNRNQPAKLFTTMRKSISALEEGHHLLIFPETGYPEYSLTSVTPFFSGFATLGQLYHRKTGKPLRFCPCYIDEQHRRICFGEPVTWEPVGEAKEETERVSEELNRRIRETADLNRGVRKEQKNPARQAVLFLCNLIRLALLIPLSGILHVTDPRIILPLYGISQGIRILFNITAGAYASTSRLPFLFSHGIGILTDFCLLTGLSAGVLPLRWLLYALAVNGAVILISNLMTAVRYRRCAGPNFYDYLSADMLCAILLLQLLKIPLPAPILWIAVLGTLMCLGLSAGFALAFNGRIGLEKAAQAPAE